VDVVEENPEQNTRRARAASRIPWTMGDVAWAIGVVIGVTVVVALGLVIGTIFLVGPATLVGSDAADLSGLLDLLAAEGLLQPWLLLMMTGMLVGEASMPVSAWLFGALKYRCGWRALGFRSFRAFDGITLAAIVVLVGLLVGFLYDVLFSHLGLDSPSSLPAGLAETGLGLGIVFVLAVVVAPVAEETFFRGFILPGIGKRLGNVWGVVLSALLFSVAHMQPGALLPIFILGLLLGWLYLRTRSIWPCILTHFAYNSIAILFML